MKGEDLLAPFGGKNAQDPGQPDQHDLSGTNDLSQPGFDGGPCRSQRLSFTTRILPNRKPENQAIEIMHQVKIPSAERRFNGLSPSVQRRDATAGHDCDGPGVQARDHSGRRTDHCAGCNHSGPDPIPPGGAQTRPRKWRMIFITHNLGIVASIADRGCGDVRRARSWRSRRWRFCFRNPAASIYRDDSCSAVPRVDQEHARKPLQHSWAGPLHRPHAAGLPFRIAVLLADRPVRRQDPDLFPLPHDHDHVVRCWVRHAGGVIRSRHEQRYAAPSREPAEIISR